MTGPETFLVCCAVILVGAILWEHYAVGVIKKQSLGDDEEYLPPFHPNCRSTLLGLSSIEVETLIRAEIESHMKTVYIRMDEIITERLTNLRNLHNGLGNTFEKMNKEFLIFEARFHHVEKKLAGMTRTVKHEFVGQLPVKMTYDEAVAAKNSLLKRAGVKK